MSTRSSTINRQIRRQRLMVAAAIGIVIAALAAALVVGFGGDDGDDRPLGSDDTVGNEPATAEPATGVERITSADAYNAREDRYIDALLAASGGDGDTSWQGLEATQGIALIERAVRTGDRSRIAEANELIEAELDAIRPDTTGGALHHGGPLALITAYLRYADEPELLYPETAERIKTGRRADGSVDEEHSLIAYRDRIFDEYTVDGVDFGIERFNPWDPKPSDEYNGTENHKLQIITAAMLLTEVYADETYDGRPVKDDTPEADDYWHYFRDAFYAYSGAWSAGYPTDHFGADVNGEEKDASQYTRAYVEDYWLLRDLHSDPVVRAHAEILLDRTLIDMAEDTVMGMYTGPAGRYYTPLPSEGVNQHVHVLDYLLFDSLGYEFPLDHAYTWGFAAWGYGNIIASEYNPASPDFPKAIVDLAVDKEDGYLVQGGQEHNSNWVEQDFALGFRTDGQVYGEGHAGGFYVYDEPARGAGLNVVPFYGDVPFDKDRPTQELDGVVASRVALVRSANPDEQLKLWIQDGFAEVAATSTWIFLRQPSSAGREVYLAVRSATAENEAGDPITDEIQRGDVRTIDANQDPLVWEVSTSDEHDSFDAFRDDIEDNELEVTDERITYASSTLDTELSYDRLEHVDHEIDGDPFERSEFEHGFHTPWSTNAYGSYEASLEKGGYAVTYDWDPDGDGDVDPADMPTKSVDNDLDD